MSEWVSVREKLPPDNDDIAIDVLVWCIYKSCEESSVAFIADDNTWHLTATDRTLECFVSHWMPLPPPPENKDC